MKLVIHGEARGKARPRFVRATGRTYTDTPTLRAEQRIRDEWRASGHKRLPDLALEITVGLYLERPKTHFRTDGLTFSAAGQRSPLPLRKPDVDNALKLVCDALNGLAYRDDALITDAHVYRRWAVDAPLTVIWVVAADPDAADPGDLLEEAA